MIHKKSKNKGFIGMLALLIVIAIMAILMVKNMGALGFGNVSAEKEQGTSAIEKAQNAKNMLEDQNRKAATE